MAVLLRNQRNPNLSLILTTDTWLGILDLAAAYQWNALGTILPGSWHSLEYSLGDYLPGAPAAADGFPNGSHAYKDDNARLVGVDDALNLSDALDRAFLDYEPRRLRASTLLYAIEDPAVDRRPSIGAITETRVFCRNGAFWVEQYQP